jgi:5,10-methylenetetrahydrofolate reductase
MAVTTFGIVCEIEPATRPDLMPVRHQVGVMSRIATAFLIPDNHIGRATVSSIAVAHEVAAMGGRSIACLNARDRNVLGFRRDLLTAAAYGIDEFLFVHGDRPETGRRSDDLTVRTMIEEARRFADSGPARGPFDSASRRVFGRCLFGSARRISCLCR